AAASTRSLIRPFAPLPAAKCPMTGDRPSPLWRRRPKAMRLQIRLLLLLCLLAQGGCGEKSTDQLLEDLKGQNELERLIAVRVLPQRKGEAAQVVPALIEVLKDKDADIRVSAANGLGYFGEQAKDAIPALQAAQDDRDARVREAAGRALSRIDPTRFPAPSKARPPRVDES